jgi:hypothetical protein
MLEDMRADLLEWPRANWEGRSATVITQFTRGGTRQAVVLSGRCGRAGPKTAVSPEVRQRPAADRDQAAAAVETLGNDSIGWGSCVTAARTRMCPSRYGI